MNWGDVTKPKSIPANIPSVKDAESGKETEIGTEEPSDLSYLMKSLESLTEETSPKCGMCDACVVFILGFIAVCCAFLLVVVIGTLSTGAYISDNSDMDVDFGQALTRTTLLFSASTGTFLGVVVVILTMLTVVFKFDPFTMADTWARDVAIYLVLFACFMPSLLVLNAITGVSFSTLFVSFWIQTAIVIIANKVIQVGLRGCMWTSSLGSVILYFTLSVLAALAIYRVVVIDLGVFSDVHGVAREVSLILSVFSMNWVVPVLPYIFPNVFQII